MSETNGSTNGTTNGSTMKRLSQLQVIQLASHLRKHKEAIEQEQYGPTQAARHAEKHLDFPVSAASIKTICEGLGEEGPTLNTSRTKGDTVRIESLVSRNHRHNRAIRLIAQRIEEHNTIGLEKAVADILNGV